MIKTKKALGFLILCVLVIGITIANGQNVARSHTSSNPSQGISTENQVNQRQYIEECEKYKFDCKISYGHDEIKHEEQQTQSQPAQKSRTVSNRSSTPILIGPTSVFTVLVIIVVVILLWLRFGGSGVLLNNSPKDIKPQGEIPENWGNASNIVSSSSNDILSGVLAIDDKRLAMIELLRMCLLHGAGLSSTRLARSDTERTIFRRLPQSLPQRDELELLLKTTELVHYGGQEITSDQFDELISKARIFLNIRKMANA
ncbi:hypothetical protein [Bartonella sp. HY406]|uniref:hypothetical protein n=1 Tax=Bartonella sp. HY406 TaxID=2979331 RepID=UPI0021C87480|nr:hypothetical protein [Bartonella sp. HY406]UXN04145.1 hypothetical protein N6B01_03680 [Bartonella sp. HY406]